MEISLNAKVECMEGVHGRPEYVLTNPVTDTVTHVVVKQDSSPNMEYVVPVEVVAETIAGTIRLSCSQAELEKMDPFIKTTFIEGKLPDRYFSYPGGSYRFGSYYYMP